MSFAPLPCPPSSLLLGQSEPEPPVPESSGSTEEAPAPSALEALVSRLRVEEGADGANFISGSGTTAS